MGMHGRWGWGRRVTNTSDADAAERYATSALESFERGQPLSLGLLEHREAPLEPQRVQDLLRPTDHVRRHDRRLVVYLTETSQEGAWQALARLTQAIEGLHVLGATQVQPEWTFARALDEALRAHARPPQPDTARGRLVADVCWSELCELLLWLCRCERSGRLTIAADSHSGHLELRGGRIVEAATRGGSRGREAALRLLDVGEAEVLLEPCDDEVRSFVPLSAEPTELLLEVARLRDERARVEAA